MQNPPDASINRVDDWLTPSRFRLLLALLIFLNILIYSFWHFWIKPSVAQTCGSLSLAQKAVISEEIAEKERVLGLQCEDFAPGISPSLEPRERENPTTSPEQKENTPPPADSPPEATAGSGSGFFVSKDLIVTNCHVIEDAPETAEITVRSKYLSEILNVRVLATECTDEEEMGRGPDFALLQVNKPPSKPVEPLKIAKGTKIPNKIWAFGYPANTFALQTIKENEVPTPALIPTAGRVEGVFLNADRKTNEGVNKKMTEVIQHSGEISGGNSGGPLIDSCGNVVGVNTFYSYSRDEIGVTPRKYALSSRMLRSFLVSQDVDYEATDMCPPNRVLSDENILEIAERSVVYVEWLKSQE